jgi:hypothetical protein
VSLHAGGQGTRQPLFQLHWPLLLLLLLQLGQLPPSLLSQPLLQSLVLELHVL